MAERRSQTCGTWREDRMDAGFGVRAVAVASLLMLAVVGAGASPAVAAPANDDWAAARLLTSFPATIRSSTANATAEAGEPESNCDRYAMSRTLWYRVRTAKTS